MVNLILGNKIILFSLMMALAPLLAAFMMIVVRQLRGYFSRRSARKAREESLTAFVEEASAVRTPPAQERTAAPAKAQEPAPAAQKAPAAAEKPAPEKKPVLAAVVQEPAKPAENEENQTSSAMNDLLSSVFADDEADEYYAALLAGLDSVDIADLSALTQQVARSLQVS